MQARNVISGIAVLLVTFGLACSPSGRTAPAVATLTLTQADSIWARNYAMHDTASALRLMPDDFFMTTSNGRVKDRASELGDIRAQSGLTMRYFRTEDVRAREYGTAGVVTGTASWAFEMSGRPSSVRRRYTAVYRRGGPLGWQLVTLHMGPAPQ